MNISFGNFGELILAIFVLMRGEQDVVRAQITGSIVGTTPFGLGIASLIGGLWHQRQKFQIERAKLLSSLMILATIALLLPAVFAFTRRYIDQVSSSGAAAQDLSLGVSIILISLYAANLIYTLITRRDVFARDEGSDEGAAWPLWKSLSVLVAATIAIAFESNVFSNAMTAAAATLHFNKSFLGVVILALVGTISDVMAGVYFAIQGKIGLVVNICVGSATQIALAVAPILVIISWIIGSPMSLVFTNPLELFAIAGAVYVVNSISGDGEITWFEGLLLIGVYAVFALSFFLVAPVSSSGSGA